MRHELQDLADNLRSERSIDAFWARVHVALRDRGVQSIFYGALSSRREVEHQRITKALIWKTSHRQEFLSAFGNGALLDNDYTVEHCVKNSDVFFWHDDACWRDASPSQRARARIENDLGFNVGFTVPSSHFCRGLVGGIGVSMPDLNQREFPLFWRENSKEILAICGMLDAGMREQHMSALVGLSRREKECLTWLAAGLRPDLIADRLHISAKSIDKYIGHAKRKLKATTRDHAVAKAILLDLIHP